MDTDAGDPVARFIEIDRAVNESALTVTIVTALMSIPFWWRDPVMAIAGWVPLVMRIIRRLWVRQPRSHYHWAQANILATGAAVVASASVTGGVDSPVLIFSIVLGVMTSMLFTHQRGWLLFPFLVTQVVTVIDWADNGLGQVDWLVPIAISLVTLSVPRFISDMVAIEVDYREKAVLDSLTGCLNRTSLGRRLTELQHQAEQTDGHVGVLAIDIDHFKTINDRHGHGVGDEVLRHIAFVIRQNLRSFELLYRTGGEEFVLLLPGADPHATYRLGETVREAVADASFPVGQVTVSVGTASERAPADVADLVDRADRSLLEAKQQGRNRTVQAST